MKCPMWIKLAARGEGIGVGGKRQRDLGASVCVCPKCGYKTKHVLSLPCTKTKCPKCGAIMAGKNN